MIAETQWLRTATVRVRPGRVGEYEALLKDIKAARERSDSKSITLVSQGVAGQQGTVFYVTYPGNSLAAFDKTPPVRQILGEEGYEKYLKVNSEVVTSTEVNINRFLPELSNPPEQVISAAPNFWRPKSTPAAAKPPATTKPKATSAAAKVQ
jgi:hypothetical protein